MKSQVYHSNDTGYELLQSNYEEDQEVPLDQLSGDENSDSLLISKVHEGSKSNFLLSVMTIIKTVVGVTILSLPSVVQELGWVFSIIIFASVLSLNQYTSILLLKAKNLSRKSNYSSIFYNIYRHKASKVIAYLLIILNNIGIGIIESMVFKETMRKVLKDIFKGSSVLEDFYTQQWFLVLIFATLQTPMLIVKKIQKLRFCAFFGVSGIAIFVVVFIIHYFNEVSQKQSMDSMEMFPTDWLAAASAIPNLILALSYQFNIFPIYKGMKNSTDKKMSLVSIVGLSFCAVAYTLIGIFGYSLYGNKEINSNVLNNIPYEDTVPFFYFAINGGYLVCVFFSLPIVFFGGRNNLIGLIQIIKQRKHQSKHFQNNNGDEVEKISSFVDETDQGRRLIKAKVYFYLYTLVLFSVVIVITITVSDISIFFNAVGAICSTSLSIILPSLFYVVLIKQKKKKTFCSYYLSIVLMMLLGPYAVFSIVAKYL